MDKKLLIDLYKAYFDARKYKSNKIYVKQFDKNLHLNLLDLCYLLQNRIYKPKPSTCFIITDPKKREIFAADFRDRIVHHLYFNVVYPIFKKYFIYDSYSCIIGRGTHFGIKRLKHHILSESLNYTRLCFVLKLDILGYFIHIDKLILLQEALRILKLNNVNDLILYLTKLIILLDPTDRCIILGNKSNWVGLPSNKSLLKAPKGFGLPIGNLTSLLFSNVYRNILDQYCKKVLKCKHYGAYVDDVFIVSHDRQFLKNIIPKIDNFVTRVLHLKLHMGKTKILDAYKGVEFLGSYIKPHRIYISNQCLRRMRDKIYKDHKLLYKKQHAMISRMGVLCHYKTFNIRKNILLQ